MKLENLSEATTLARHREIATRLMEDAQHGTISCKVGTTDVFTVIASGHVRKAVADACREFIAEKDSELAALGVETPEVETP